MKIGQELWVLEIEISFKYRLYTDLHDNFGCHQENEFLGPRSKIYNL